MTTDIRDDGRTIQSISSVTSPAEYGWHVGGPSGTTAIVPYPEAGQMAEVTWFAVYVGDELRWRVPAHDMIVEYAPGPQADGAS